MRRRHQKLGAVSKIGMSPLAAVRTDVEGARRIACVWRPRRSGAPRRPNHVHSVNAFSIPKACKAKEDETLSKGGLRAVLMELWELSLKGKGRR